MDYEIKWLDEARRSLDAEMEYIYAEFGKATLDKVYTNLMGRIAQLQMFPRIGIRCEDLDYHGYKIRMLHIKKMSVVYSIVNDTLLILYIWNNQQSPDKLATAMGLL